MMWLPNFESLVQNTAQIIQISTTQNIPQNIQNIPIRPGRRSAVRRPQKNRFQKSNNIA
jgi:hypothetical protein